MTLTKGMRWSSSFTLLCVVLQSMVLSCLVYPKEADNEEWDASHSLYMQGGGWVDAVLRIPVPLCA
jgi:hypothetical protein